jgi:hypothetical protein
MQQAENPESELAARVGTDRPVAMTAGEMLRIMEEEGLIGMWKDRDDIGDSVEFARKLRERTWQRGSE